MPSIDQRPHGHNTDPNHDHSPNNNPETDRNQYTDPNTNRTRSSADTDKLVRHV